MDQVSSGLFVGTLADAADEELLTENGIDRIVSLTYGDPEAGYPKSISISQCPMMDGPRNDEETFQEAVEAVLSGFDQDETVLIHCSRGASRSPAVAATAVAIYEQIEIAESFERIGNRRPEFDPHIALVGHASSVYRNFNRVQS